MAAAGEGPSSGYGGNGGGVGGKFRKRPFRKAAHATPYDRPPTPLGNGNPSWLSKLVVEPASKLIASGAQRFFASVFRKRLPPPPPPPPPEVRQVSSKEPSETVEKAEAQEAAVGMGTNPHHNPVNGGISDLEGLLKKNTFTRSEVDHLTELLLSRTVEGSHKEDFRTEADDEKLVTNSERQQQYLSSPLVGKSMPHDLSHGLNSTPAISKRVLEEDIASPAEIAKAYMGNQASRISPSMLGLRPRAVREDATLLRNVPFTPKSSGTPMATKGAHVEGLGNGFVTPRSQGRSAIYSMARTPYSRVHPTAFGKGSGSRLSSFGGPLPALSVNEQPGELGSNRTALKRRSSVLDDDLGSVGPMRRTRQKPSMLSHNTLLHQGIGSSSTARQRSVTDERAQRGSKVGGENDYIRTSRTSYGHVPPKSTETAEKIFDHLEKLTSNSKSPAKLTTDMLRGQALKSLEDADSSKLLYNNHVRNKLDGGSPSKQSISGNSSKGKDRTEIVFQKSVSHNNVSTPAENGDIKTKEGTSKSVEASHFVAKADAQHPPKKQGFTMSFHEDLDDDTSCDGPTFEITPKVNANQEKQNSASVEKSFPDKLPVLPSDRTPPESIFGKSSDLEGVDTGKASVPLFSGASSAASSLFTTPPSSLEFESTKQANPTGPEPWSFTLPNPDRILAGSVKGIDNSVVAAAKTNGKMDNSPSVPVSSTTSSGIFSSFSNTNNGPPAASPSIFSPITPVSTGISNPFLTNGTSNIASSASTSSSCATALFSTDSTSTTISSTTEAAVAPKTTFNILPASNPSISASNAEVHAAKIGKESCAVNSSSLFSSTTSFTTAGTGSSSYFGQSKPSTAASLGQDFLASSSGGAFLNAHIPVSGSGVASVTAMLPVQFASSAPLVFGSSPVVTSTSSGAPFSSTSVSETKPFGTSGGIFGGFNSVAPSSAINVISSNSNNTSFSSGESSSAATASVTNATGSSTSASTFVFGVSSSATTATVTDAIGSSTSGYNSFASNSSAGNVASSSSASVGGFGANPFSSTAFSYGSSPSFLSASSAPVFGASSAPVFGSSTGGSLGSSFPFAATAASTSSSQPPFGAQPGFVASAPSFNTPAVNNDQMQEETMAEDPVNLSMPAAPMFGQEPGNMFQSSNPFSFTGQPSQAAPQNPFAFTGQQNQAVPQNPIPFQASGSQEFSAGGSGSFSIGSGAMGGDKAGRKFVKPNRIRRKK